MISLPLSPETELLVARLSDDDKRTLSLIIQAFVRKPERTMSQVMDDMALYAKRQGLPIDKLDDLLKSE
jgi:hypothetical protein